MWRTITTALVSFFALSPAFTLAAAKELRGSTAIERATSLVEGFIGTAEADKHKAELDFTGYKKFWEGTETRLQASIAETKLSVQALEAIIEQLTQELEQIASKVVEVNGEAESATGQKTAADATRKAEHTEFIKQAVGFNDALVKIEQAINTLKSKPLKIPQAGAAVLAQLANHPQLPADAKAAFNSFLGMLDDDDDKDKSSASPKAYESRSSNIIDLLSNLRDTFRKNLGDAQKEELRKQGAYDKLLLSLQGELNIHDRKTRDLNRQKGEKGEKLASSQKLLQGQKDKLAGDESELASGSAAMAAKQNAHDVNMQLRSDELAALRECLNVLKGQIVANASQHFALTQYQKSAVSLAQFMAAKKDMPLYKSARVQIKEFLEERAGEIHSHQLTLLATKIAADPFVKVKNLISDMIVKLEREAIDETSAKTTCDHQLAMANISRNKLAEEVEGLTADIENKKATLFGLEEAISTTATEIQELESEKAEALKNWLVAKVDAENSIHESGSAKAAVTDVLKSLKEFYMPHPFDNTTLLQIGAGRRQLREYNPEYNPAETGNTVIALMMVIENDFKSLEDDLKKQLVADTSEQQSLDAGFATNIATKTKSNEMQGEVVTAEKERLSELTDDLGSKETKLESENSFFSKLVEQCQPKGLTLEERMEKRKDEIESLKQALEMLKGPD